MSKFSALDIANFYVQLANSLPESNITNLKLNKICYYAQGWSLAKYGIPLFDEGIEAWKYGPVIPSVYKTYNVCGRNPIAEPYETFDESNLSTKELNLLVDVYRTYGKYTAEQLLVMTHEKNGPWANVYEEHKNREITQESMKTFFGKSKELASFSPVFTKENVSIYA